MSCEQCYHNEVCEALYEMNGIPRIGTSQCAYFRDKKDIVPRERYENVLENLKAVLAERGEEDG